jgi:hypothetical protein
MSFLKVPIAKEEGLARRHDHLGIGLPGENQTAEIFRLICWDIEFLPGCRVEPPRTEGGHFYKPEYLKFSELDVSGPRDNPRAT